MSLVADPAHTTVTGSESLRSIMSPFPTRPVRIGRVVTAPRFRGNGLAARLVAHLSDAIDGRIVLDAQSYLVGWYEQLGFVVAGLEFVEDGIPHVPMSLR